VHVATGFLAGFLLAGGNTSIAQQTFSRFQAAATTPVNLSEVVRNLPEYSQPEQQQRDAYLAAIENATIAERDLALPNLMQWIEDKRPEVRVLALLSLELLYLPSDKRPGSDYRSSYPAQYVPAVAAHLRDPDPAVRKVAFAALQPVQYSGVGLDELIKLVVPMLREPDVLTEYPDPFFIEADKRMLARMTPEQQAQFKAMPPKIIKMPAEGPWLLAILAGPNRQPSNDVDDAMIAFLDREDQTKSTLGDCLHTLELSLASERVNDEALRRVFELKGMTIFLLQFVTQLRLTPEQMTAQRERLVELSNDEAAHPALRRAARDVAACWNGDTHKLCRPSDMDASQQLDTR